MSICCQHLGAKSSICNINISVDPNQYFSTALDEGDGTGHDARRPCGVTVRHNRAHGQTATPTRKRLFSGGAANGRRSGGGRARQVRGSGSSGRFDGLDAHRHSLDAKSTVLTHRQSQHFVRMTRIEGFLGWIRGWRAQPAG